MAARFWVGGTGTWDASDTTHWSASTGGASGASAPGVNDAATLDGASGGGTVTVNATISVQSITCGAFTGTLDFSANNNNVNLTATTGFNGSGSGTRTINLGNGTWTMTGTSTPWTMTTTTNLTFNANSSVLVFTATSASGRTFNGGGLTYNTVTVSANTLLGQFSIGLANHTFATLNITAPNAVSFPSSQTTTITNAPAWTGTSANLLYLYTNSSSTAGTISVATGSPTIAWGALRTLTFSGGASFSASSSFDLGINTGITITAPSGGSASMQYRNLMRGNLG